MLKIKMLNSKHLPKNGKTKSESLRKLIIELQFEMLKLRFC